MENKIMAVKPNSNRPFLFSKKIYAGWREVMITVVGMSSSPGPFAFAALGVFMLPLSDAFGWSRVEISSAFTVLTITTALSSPIVGRIVDIVGARKVLLVSLVALGICMAALGAFMTSLWHLLLIYGLIGTFAAGSNSLPYMRVLSVWFDRNRGLAIGIGIGGIGLGYAYVPLIIHEAIKIAGWRFGFGALALIIFCISLPLLFWGFRNSPLEAGVSDASERVKSCDGASRESTDSGLSPQEIYRSKTFWLMAVIFVILSFVLNGTLAHLMPMLVDRGITTEIAALAMSSVGVMMVLSRIVIGFLVDRFFAPHVAVVCFSLSMAGIAIFSVSSNVYLVFFGALMLGFSIGAETDLMAYLIGRYFGFKSFGVIYGSIFAATLAGTALGPMAFGIAYELLHTYGQVLLASVVLNLVAVVLTSRLTPFPEVFAGRPA